MKMNSSKLALFAAVAAFGATFAITSCSKVPIEVNVPMDFADITFEVPATDQDSIDYADTATVTTDIDKVLADNKVSKDDIQSIKIEMITATCDSTGNFGKLRSIKGEVASTGAFTTVGNLTDNPADYKTSLTIPANTTDEFRDFLNSNTFKLRVSGRTQQRVDVPFTIKVRMKVIVNAKKD